MLRTSPSYPIFLSLPKHEYLAGRALDYRKVIDDFVAKTRELRQYELTSDDWNAIELVIIG